MGMTARDFTEINQLHALYCHAVDFGDFDGVISCFAPDGAFELAGEPDHPANRRGREAIGRSPSVRAAKGHGRHTTFSSITDGDGSTARSISLQMGTHDYGPPVGRGQATYSSLFGSGTYFDDLIKIDGRWVYAHRRFVRDGSQAMLDLLGKPLHIRPVSAKYAEGGLKAIDYEAIRQLITRVGYALDFEDYDGFVACFTEDGTLDDGDGLVSGQGALREYAVSYSEAGYHGHCRHRAISSVIEGDGGRALVSSYGLVSISYGVLPQPRPPSTAALVTTGIYRDEVVKVEDRWLLSQRTFRKDTTADVETLVGRPLELTPFGSSRASKCRTPSQGKETAQVTEADHEEIRQLLARFSQTLDFADVDGFVACFANGGVLDTSAAEEGLAGVHVGHPELRRFATATLDYSGGRVRQSAVNLIIASDGVTAKVSSYAIVTRAHVECRSRDGVASESTRAALVTTGMFFDELAKVDGRWVFTRRQFRHDGLPDVLDRMFEPVIVGPKDAV